MSSSLAFAPLAKSVPAASAGRLKQSAARWCFSKIAMDDLCRQAAELGLSGIDLVDEKDWPTCAKYGLVPAMVSGAGGIPVLEAYSRVADLRPDDSMFLTSSVRGIVAVASVDDHRLHVDEAMLTRLRRLIGEAEQAAAAAFRATYL